MEQLPFRPKTVMTPVGVESHGKELDVEVSLPYPLPATIF